MFNVFRFMLQVLWFIAAFLIIMLGLNWLDPEIGQGLHPAIAFTLGGVIMIIVIRSVIDDILDEIMLRRAASFHAQARAKREQNRRDWK